jgi:tetratricopeptide (TPR) repeat protein
MHMTLTRSTPRHPAWKLIFALIVLVGAILWRVWQERSAPVRSTASAPAPIERSSPDYVARIEQRLRANRDDTQAYAELGLALLQQVRESGDVTLYGRAGEAFTAALQRDPQQVDALVGQGVLALALHDFTSALTWADKAWALNPFRAQTLGIKVDGLVELGRYEEAVNTLQQMVDLRPDLRSYSRVSYLRELHGQVDGAIEAMQTAASMGAPGSEEWLWTTVQLGNLYWNNGRLVEAKQSYEQALHFRGDYPFALVGLARVQAAQGEVASAISQLENLVKRLPLPEFVVLLGEWYAASGQIDKAQQQYDLVRVMQKLNASQGMNVDLELATFEVNQGNDPAMALQQARAAHQARPTIYAADTLAWALYQNGELGEAQRYSQEALRLGTRDALLHFHAGLIASALGEQAAARQSLTTALAINPHFSPLHAREARVKLDELR